MIGCFTCTHVVCTPSSHTTQTPQHHHTPFTHTQSHPGHTFESPSAFSIHVKRLVNPSRKADDGWKTVKYEKRYLESFKVALAKQKHDGGDTSVGPIPEPRPQKRQRVVGTPDVDGSTGRNGGFSNGMVWGVHVSEFYLRAV